MTLLTQERYHAILQVLNDRNAVTVAELSAMLDTSESTIRRDLTYLADTGKLNKVFGGATSITQSSGITETEVGSRENTMSEEKTLIARYAATLIHSGDFVFIDAGTTTLRLIDFIDNRKATYVTNGIHHARRLIQKGLDAYIIGGKIKPVTEAVVGAEGIKNMQGLNFTKAFMGTNGIDIDSGFTTPDIDEALMKETAINKSYMPFMLADHTKFRRVFAVTFSQLKKCCIITDKVKDKKFFESTVIKEVNI